MWSVWCVGGLVGWVCGGSFCGVFGLLVFVFLGLLVVGWGVVCFFFVWGVVGCVFFVVFLCFLLFCWVYLVLCGVMVVFEVLLCLWDARVGGLVL